MLTNKNEEKEILSTLSFLEKIISNVYNGPKEKAILELLKLIKILIVRDAESFEKELKRKRRINTTFILMVCIGLLLIVSQKFLHTPLWIINLYVIIIIIFSQNKKKF